MMHGHFGAALIISALTGRAAPLWQLFIASQIQDLAIAVLVYILHIEETRIQVSGENKVYPIELLSIPYSHSMFTTLVLAQLCYALPSRGLGKHALSAAVLSHWMLDLLVHLPDLDLCFPFYDCGKVGLGLWRHQALSVTVESALVAVGTGLYLAAAPNWASATSSSKRLLPLACFMVITTVAMPYAPPPPRLDWTITLQTYLVYGAFVWFAVAVERPMCAGEGRVKKS